ncbi:MAG: FAD-dependent oxidoreductase [Puniceicoccaceae bacterium]|nr:FAD-dependent oxidoreductase [Puniceicoccaceae bacterium]|tara:strand:- start:536 stop:1780 length:1245 start_codon:yes stop_codon:yes gene_type:complete
MKVAVIGSGISGNVAAYHLNKHHKITVYEANDYIGGHTHTHDINHQGKHFSVDTGFIVFNHKTYPKFIALLKELGVEEQLSTMSFGVKCEKTGLEYMGSTINSLFAQRRNIFRPSFWRMILDILRFNREATQLLEQLSDEISLGDYLKREKYSQVFINYYLVPMAAAVWSADLKLMFEFPARYLVRFFHNHGLLSVNDRPDWYVVKGGSKTYAQALTRPFKDCIKLSTPVTRVERLNKGVRVISAEGEATYDAVFFACHSDQALKMIHNPTEAEKQVLGAIKYQDNEVLLHTDDSVLPKRKSAWAAWNYHLLDGDQSRVPVTYNMNILQGLDCSDQFCVTLNNSDVIDKDKVLKRLTYHHPIYTRESVAAQARHAEINTDKFYFCGAYWRYGFHEDGVVSALNAVKQFERDCCE